MTANSDGTRAAFWRESCSCWGCGLLVRRNIIFILMSIEIMLNAAGLAFVVAGSRWGQPDGQVMFIFILAMAAAEVAVGLALVLRLYRHHHDAGCRRRQRHERLSMLDLLWLIPALPFVGSLVLRCAGPFPESGGVDCGRRDCGVSRWLSLLVADQLPERSARRPTLTRRSCGPGSTSAGFIREIAFYLDPLSLIMMLVVTFVASSSTSIRPSS